MIQWCVRSDGGAVGGGRGVVACSGGRRCQAPHWCRFMSARNYSTVANIEPSWRAGRPAAVLDWFDCVIEPWYIDILGTSYYLYLRTWCIVIIVFISVLCCTSETW